MRKRHLAKYGLPAILMGFAATLAAQNLSLPKAGEIHLNDLLAAKGVRRMQFTRIFAVSFSPDSSRLAIEFGDASDQYVLRVNRPAIARYLLVATVADPAGASFWIDLTKLEFGNGEELPFSELSWSPDGNYLSLGNVLIHVPGGETCRLPFRPARLFSEGTALFAEFQGGGMFGGFLNAGTGLFTLPFDMANGTPTTFGLVDSQCRTTGQWTANRPVSMDGISPDGRQVAFLETVYKDGRAASANLILTPAKPLDLDRGRKIRIAAPEGGNAVFVDGAVCRLEKVAVTSTLTGVSRETLSTIWARDVHIRCWDTQTGKPVRESGPNWTGAASLAPLSAGGGRVAIGDNGQGNAVPPVHSIWDFQTGKILSRWSPETDEGNGSGWGMRLGFAISPDGRLVAEGRSDSVLLYRVPK